MISAIVLSLAVTSAPASSSPLKIAVVELGASVADAGLAGAATSAVVRAMASLKELPKGSTVLGPEELKAIVNQQALDQLAGCDGDRCTLDLAKVISADRVVAGRVGVVGGDALIFLSLIDPGQGVVLARSSRIVPLNAAAMKKGVDVAAQGLLEDTAQESLRLLGLSLIDPAAAKSTGDAPLEDLSLAVLFDEIGTSGEALRMRPVETCASKHLSEAGANVVAPAVVQRIKGMAAPRTLLDGTVPEALTSDEVDALLGGIVEYKAGAGFAGTHSVEADLSMQLMKVDTGDVLASEQKHVRHPAHTENAAQKAAADRLCQQIRPALEAALKKRSARGVRVVVTVGGVDADAAGALAAALEKGARVARARVKSVTAKGATVQVTLSGGDGVALALEVPRLEPTYVVSTASAGQLTLARSPSKAEGAP